ncbi:sugar phosphate isomerase/epimerase family protein [Novipirellula artificiosorum]|uniref:Xylose isomerase-like TIM barrel n=1 Tax=Novipirellula artificiosorum TaxID=2528016 RepID=A0A5C6CYQ9_9BACT|nr:TIM barrel protein [Novipirellula artificiosorum]TWU28734.1 Xylose isomerase-like TIM barrel [Novipirellula artificiosorum]
MPLRKHRLALFMSFFIASIASAPCQAQSPATEPVHRPFFAFDNGVGRGSWTPQQQAELLSELGYAGMGGTGLNGLPEFLEAMRQRGLKLFSTYIPVNVADDKNPYDPKLPDAIRELAGSGTVLWVHVHADSASGKAATGQMDDRAVDVLRGVADMAAASGIEVVLYPHNGLYVATTRDAVRLVTKIDRPNVGASFNLCHFLKQNDETDLEACLAEAAPYLRLVSINGCDSGETKKMNWDRLIQTLDSGSFDVSRVMALLDQHHYDGPVGLQCYQVPGEIPTNLKRSMAAWKRLNADR